MKKFLLSGAVVLAFVLYLLRGQFSKSPTPTPATTDKDSTSSDTGTTSAPYETTNPGGLNPSPTPAPTPVPSGKYKDGSYTGPVTDAFYGPMQVKAIISGGKLTDVVFLQYPNDRETSIEISNMAIPKLKAEAIATQSANVDVVSGATQSSQAFVQSLASALLHAQS